MKIHTAHTVPQVFYDLIARLIPGIVLICCLYTVCYGSTNSLNHFMLIMKYSVKGLALLFTLSLIVAYTLSNILSGFISCITNNSCCKKLSTRLSFRSDLSDLRRKNIIDPRTKHVIYELYKIPNINIPSIPFAYDYIRLKSPHIGAKLVKLRAECEMCKILAFGWSLLFFINLKNACNFDFIEFLYMELTLFIAIIGIMLLLKSLNKAFLTALYNYWIMLH